MDNTFAVLQTAADISKTAIDNSDQLAVEAVDLFLALIGAEAGHMGLRSLASGGIYICGGIMPKVSHHCWKEKKRKEKFTLFSDHNRSLLRRQFGDHCWTIVTNTYAHMGSPRS